MLDMQMGFFRILQGAAYRVKSECFALNCETDKKVKDMPYVLSDFVNFLGDAVEWYKCLGIVDPACHPVLDRVVSSARQMRAKLAADIASFDQSKDMTPGQRLAHEAHDEKVREARIRQSKAISAMKKESKFKTLVRAHKDSLLDYKHHDHEEDAHDRAEEMKNYYASMKPGEVGSRDELIAWKDSTWFYVIEDVSAPLPPAGSMVPVKYWYDDFMPKLLTAFSVSTKQDVEELEMSEELRMAADDAWFRQKRDSHLFDQFGGVVVDSWEFLEASQKRSVRQAWRLMEPYFHGAQKMRERFEGTVKHRYTGSLSDYVVFIDVFLGKTNGRDGNSRCSFPYFLGPATWTQFHCSAEIVSLQPKRDQANSIEKFKKYFLGFMDCYACPFCRHHFNAFVKLGKETELYPLEFLLFGWKPPSPETMKKLAMANEGFSSILQLSAADRLAAVTDGDSMRFLLWKLHNAVNSSIARGEEWFTRKKEFRMAYTNRYWPAVDIEIARWESLDNDSISCDTVGRIHKLEVLGAALSRLRHDLTSLLEEPQLSPRARQQEGEEVLEVMHNIMTVIDKLDSCIQKSNILQEAYCYDKHAPDYCQAVLTAKQEAFARSGLYTEH